MIVDSIDTAQNIIMYYNNPNDSYIKVKLNNIKEKLDKYVNILNTIDNELVIKENRICKMPNILKTILPKTTIEYKVEKSIYINCPKNAIITKITSENNIVIKINNIQIGNKMKKFSKTWFPFCLVSKYELEITTLNIDIDSKIEITYRFLPKCLIEKIKKQRIIMTVNHKDYHFYNNDIFSL